MENNDQQKVEQTFDRIKFFSLGMLAMLLVNSLIKTTKKS